MNRRHSSYFETRPDAPAPLSVVVQRQVRYEEVDALGVVWHGRYVSFLEEGRVGFGEHYGLTYMTLYENGILSPIVQMHVDFHQPLRLAEKFEITAELIWSDSARINFQYRIQSASGTLNATGFTVQLFTDQKLKTQLVRPALIEEFCDRWKRGLLA